MKTARAWLDEYSISHQNPANRKIHFFCIPAIVFSIVCALKAIPIGDVWVNPATAIIVLALAYYLALSRRLATGLLLALALLYAGAVGLQVSTRGDLIWVALEIFVAAWVGQFAGHYIEGAKPSFFKDLQFLLIGPMWEMAHLYGLFGIAVDEPAPAAPTAPTA